MQAKRRKRSEKERSGGVLRECRDEDVSGAITGESGKWKVRTQESSQ